MRQLGRALVVVTLASATLAAAQEPPSETEITVDNAMTSTGFGLGFGGPLGAAATVELLHGLGADVKDEDERVKGVVGLLLQLHGGSGGGKLSVGVGGRARVETEDFAGLLAAGLKLSLARTWGSPLGTEAGLSYLGPELDLSFKHVAVSLGPLWRLGGGPGRSVVFSWSVGLRL